MFAMIVAATIAAMPNIATMLTLTLLAAADAYDDDGDSDGVGLVAASVSDDDVDVAAVRDSGVRDESRAFTGAAMREGKGWAIDATLTDVTAAAAGVQVMIVALADVDPSAATTPAVTGAGVPTVDGVVIVVAPVSVIAPNENMRPLMTAPASTVTVVTAMMFALMFTFAPRPTDVIAMISTSSGSAPLVNTIDEAAAGRNDVDDMNTN